MGVRQDAPMWDEFPVLQTMDFQELVDQYQEVKDTIEALETKKKDLGQQIEAALIVSDQKRVRYGEFYCVEQAKGRSAAKISSQKLVSLGVAPDTISAATIPGDPYTYVQLIDLRKQAKGGESTPDANA